MTSPNISAALLLLTRLSHQVRSSVEVFLEQDAPMQPYVAPEYTGQVAPSAPAKTKSR